MATCAGRSTTTWTTDNGGRPLVIVGVEQGGTLADRLMREEIAARPASSSGSRRSI